MLTTLAKGPVIWIKIYHHFLLAESDILKSIVTIVGACPECKNQLEIKTDM